MPRLARPAGKHRAKHVAAQRVWDADAADAKSLAPQRNPHTLRRNVFGDLVTDAGTW
jgi:hypothetical protein